MSVVRSWLKVIVWGTGFAQLLVRKGSSDQHMLCSEPPGSWLLAGRVLSLRITLRPRGSM